MSTHRSEGEIQAFLDDQLLGRERAAMAQHLMGCAECRALYDELQAAKSLVSAQIGLLDVDPPAVPEPRVARRLARASGSLTKAAILVLLAAGAVAAASSAPVRDWVVRAVDRRSVPVSPEPTSPLAAVPAELAVAPAWIEGSVLGEGGEALPFARLEVLGDTISGWSDDGGTYRLDGLPGERWVVRATHPGYRSMDEEVVLPEEGGLELDIPLEKLPGPTPEPLEGFEPFRVTYTLPVLLNTEDVTSAIQRRYPPGLAEQRFDRQAVLRLWLDEQGRVARSTLYRSSGQSQLDVLALSAGRLMRFSPAAAGDQPVRVIVLMPVRFVPPPDES